MSDARHRTLRFAVTGALVGIGATALACAPKHTNPGPIEPPTVNEGPEPTPTPTTPEHEPDHVNPGPVEDPAGTSEPEKTPEPVTTPQPEKKPKVIANPGPVTPPPKTSTTP